MRGWVCGTCGRGAADVHRLDQWEIRKEFRRLSDLHTPHVRRVGLICADCAKPELDEARTVDHTASLFGSD